MLKPGYKQTEWGIRPIDWQEMRLGENLRFQVGFPFSSEFFNKKCEGLRLVKNRDLKADDDIHYFKGDYPKSHLVADGDVLIGMDGDFMPCFWDKGTALLNQRVGRVQTNSKLNKKFIYYFLIEPLKEIEQSTGSTTVKHLSHGQVENIVRCLPPPAEQQAIADTLGAVDALLREQRALLAKKRDLKLATQTALLTRARRLPGFTGEWQERTLGELATVNKGTQLHKSKMNEGGEFAHLNGGITPSGFTREWNVEADTIAISEGGNSCGYVQLMEQQFWCGGHCYAVAPKNRGINNQFLYHALKGRQEEIMDLRVGSGLPNVQKTALLNLLLSLPVLTEQRAIAQLLTDLDAELAALAAQIAKTEALKQGLMQDLLTGTIRLRGVPLSPTPL